jgi:dihydrofolate reductase
MRKIVYGGAVSLDFYLARPDGGVDWLLWSDDAKAIMAEWWPRFDTILMGRKTFEVAFQSSKGQGSSSSAIITYVFSRTWTASPDPNAQLVTSDAAGFVHELKKQPGKDICLMGGGLLAASLLAAGLVDEIGFNIHPVLLGQGIPALPPMDRSLDLELVTSRAIQKGCVYVVYRVKNRPGSAQ